MVRGYRHGLKMPYNAMKVARKAGLPYYVLAAFLEQETGGGRNVFGHDPTIFVGAGRVTKRKYLRYKRMRDANPRNRKMQGVGPLQLTWYEFQDEADRLGGCWKPYISMLVGARLLAQYAKESNHNWVKVGERFNGSHEYGLEVKAKIDAWHQKLFGK